MNVELFGWSIGSLLILSAFLLRGPLRRADLAMITVIVTVFIAYFFNYFSGGPDFGARYWDLMSVPLVALTARGIVTLGTRRDGATEVHRAAGSPGPGPGPSSPRAENLCVGMAVTFLPWRSLDKYHHYLNMRPDVRTMAFGRSLVTHPRRGISGFRIRGHLQPARLAGRCTDLRTGRIAGDPARSTPRPGDRPVWASSGRANADKGCISSLG